MNKGQLLHRRNGRRAKPRSLLRSLPVRSKARGGGIPVSLPETQPLCSVMTVQDRLQAGTSVFPWLILRTDRGGPPVAPFLDDVEFLAEQMLEPAGPADIGSVPQAVLRIVSICIGIPITEDGGKWFSLHSNCRLREMAAFSFRCLGGGLCARSYSFRQNSIQFRICSRSSG